MKKITKILMLCAVLSLFAVTKNYAQEIVVRARLHHRVDVRPVRPSVRHVWVSAEWVPVRGRYEYRAGYWAIPPRRGLIWVDGHWIHRRHGYVWIPGHWR